MKIMTQVLSLQGVLIFTVIAASSLLVHAQKVVSTPCNLEQNSCEVAYVCVPNQQGVGICVDAYRAFDSLLRLNREAGLIGPPPNRQRTGSGEPRKYRYHFQDSLDHSTTSIVRSDTVNLK